jgi:CheY-like chemotaxis protein
MNGVEIAEAAQQRQPDLKVLFTTGYAQSAITENGAMGSAVHVISKPYRPGPREDLTLHRQKYRIHECSIWANDCH